MFELGKSALRHTATVSRCGMVRLSDDIVALDIVFYIYLKALAPVALNVLTPILA